MGKVNFNAEKGKNYSKNFILALQHTFAMFGATVLVPMICNLSVSMTLLSAGIGTLIFYFVTKRKVPVFLGSSFAFVQAIAVTMNPGGERLVIGSEQWLQAYGKVAVGLMFAGLVYILISLLVKFFGVEKIKKLFPPIVIGPVITVIGLNLAPVVFKGYIAGSYASNPEIKGKVWIVVITTAVVIVFISAFMKRGFINSTAVLFGIIVGYIMAVALKIVDYSTVKNADWIIFQKDSIALFKFYKYMQFDLKTVLLFAPLALVTCMEHIGDISVNSAITGKNFLVDPGLNRTILGDGLATMTAGFLGGPANTTYGENTAILAITKNYNPNLIALAACFAIIMGIFGKVGGFISTIPSAVIGGASLILFGMIAANGLKVLIDAKLDFSRARYTFTASLILVIGIGMSAAEMNIMLKTVAISPLAFVTILGVVINQLFELAEKVIGIGGVDQRLDEEKNKFFEFYDRE